MSITIIFVLLLLGAAFRRTDLLPFSPQYINPLRGILALLIVAHHLGQRTDIPFLSGFCGGIGYSIVAIFFFISGYGLCVSYVRKGEGYLDGFFSKRFGKLLPPFILLTIVAILAKHCSNLIPVSIQLHDLIHKGFTPLPFSWFIYVIIFSYITFYISAKIGKTVGRTGILFFMCSICYILFITQLTDFGNHWWWTVLSLNLGYFVAQFEPMLQRVLSRNRRLLIFLTIAALCLSLFAIREFPEYDNATYISWILIQPFAVYQIVRSLGVVEWKWLLFVGSISFELYLVHGLPLMFLNLLGLPDIVFWISTFIFSVSGAYVLKRVLAYSDKAIQRLRTNSL